MDKPPRSRYEAYEIRVMARRDLKDCPFNPRKISAHAKQLLRARIAQIGLLEPPVWNEPTGYLISGHQRLAILDALEGHDNYELQVAVTQLSEEDARGQLVFFNNPAVQGTWDLDRLLELCQVPDVDLEKMGLEPFDLQFLFAPDQLATIQPKQAVPPPLTDDAPAPATAYAQEADGVEALRQAKRAGARRMAERDRTDFYVVVVFPTPQARERFLDRLNLSPVETYLPAAVLEAALWPSEAHKPHASS